MSRLFKHRVVSMACLTGALMGLTGCARGGCLLRELAIAIAAEQAGERISEEMERQKNQKGY